MPYRDAMRAAEVRVAALESEIAALERRAPAGEGELQARIREREQALRDAMQDLAHERQRADRAQALHAAERESARRSFEARLEAERARRAQQATRADVQLHVDKSRADARIDALEQRVSQLTSRVLGLEAEVTALLESPDRAAHFYRERIAATRAAIAESAAARARDEGCLDALKRELLALVAQDAELDRVRLAAEQRALELMVAARVQLAEGLERELVRLERAAERIEPES
jgi:hypothetical protein